MKKNKVRLTESQLHRVIKESVERMLKPARDEAYGTHYSVDNIWNAVVRIIMTNFPKYKNLSVDYDEDNDVITIEDERVGEGIILRCEAISHLPQ